MRHAGARAVVPGEELAPVLLAVAAVAAVAVPFRALRFERGEERARQPRSRARRAKRERGWEKPKSPTCGRRIAEGASRERIEIVKTHQIDGGDRTMQLVAGSHRRRGGGASGMLVDVVQESRDVVRPANEVGKVKRMGG